MCNLDVTRLEYEIFAKYVSNINPNLKMQIKYERRSSQKKSSEQTKVAKLERPNGQEILAFHFSTRSVISALVRRLKSQATKKKKKKIQT